MYKKNTNPNHSRQLWLSLRSSHHSDFKDLYKEIYYYMETRTTNVSGGKYKEIEMKAQKEAEQCRYCVYYENWDAINKMISDKLKVVKEATKKKEQDK